MTWQELTSVVEIHKQVSHIFLAQDMRLKYFQNHLRQKETMTANQLQRCPGELLL